MEALIMGLLNPAAWASPLGVGSFLVMLGIFIFLLNKADKEKKSKK